MTNKYIDFYIEILSSFIASHKTKISNIEGNIYKLTNQISIDSKVNLNYKDIINSKLNSNDIIKEIEDNIYKSFKSKNVAESVRNEIVSKVIKDISSLIDMVESCNLLKDEFEKNIKHEFSVANVAELVEDIVLYHEDKDISDEFNNAKQNIVNSYNKNEISSFNLIEEIINTYNEIKHRDCDSCEDKDEDEEEYYYEDYDNNHDC